MALAHWVVIVRCTWCGSWLEEASMSLHIDLCHGGLFTEKEFRG